MRHFYKQAVQQAMRQAKIEKFAFKARTFQNLMHLPGSFGILSAYREGVKKQNKILHGKLLGDLQRMGYRTSHPLKGQWEGVSEKSVLVPRIKPKDLFFLGRKYGQDAVIYKGQDGLVGMYYLQGTPHAEVAITPEGLQSFDVSLDKDLFSRSRNWSFNLGFLWGQEIPWTGGNPITSESVGNYVSQGMFH